MDENKCLPSLHPNSDDNPWEHNQIGFTTLSGVASIGEASDNNNRAVPTPTRTTLGGEYSIIPDERNEYFPPSSKRLRGRPSGSRNKPKNHDLLEEEIDNILNLIVVEIPAGNDIAESLINVAHSHNASITVLSGSGFVSDVTLLHSVSRVPAAPMPGPFNMISLSGTYINPNFGLVHPQLIKNPSCSSFSIHLSGILGRVYGGFIGGKVMAASQVMITATLFNQSVFHKLPSTSRTIEEDEEDERSYVVGVPKC